MLQFDLTMRTGLLMIVGLASIVSIIAIMIILLFTYIKVLHMIISIIGMVLLSMVNIKLICTLKKLFHLNNSIFYSILKERLNSKKKSIIICFLVFVLWRANDHGWKKNRIKSWWSCICNSSNLCWHSTVVSVYINVYRCDASMSIEEYWSLH